MRSQTTLLDIGPSPLLTVVFSGLFFGSMLCTWISPISLWFKLLYTAATAILGIPTLRLYTWGKQAHGHYQFKTTGHTGRCQIAKRNQPAKPLTWLSALCLPELMILRLRTPKTNQVHTILLTPERLAAHQYQQLHRCLRLETLLQPYAIGGPYSPQPHWSSCY